MRAVSRMQKRLLWRIGVTLVAIVAIAVPGWRLYSYATGRHRTRAQLLKERKILEFQRRQADERSREEAAKKAVPHARTFDKLILRAGLARDDAYCLLSGFNYGHHSHMDANAICSFVDRGELFLFDHGYMVEQLQEHCTLAIVRDGVWRKPPEVAELAAVGDFAGAGHIASVLHDNNGMDWTRHLVWVKGRATVVIDALQAREPGSYGVQAVWRSRGAVEVDATGLTAT